MRKRRQVKKNIPVVLTTKVTEATLDSGGSSENRFGGGDGAGLGKSEGTAGGADSNTT